MNAQITIYTLTALMLVNIIICSGKEHKKTDSEMTLKQKTARFAPVEISADISKLDPGDKKALEKIIEAARLMDQIYFRQVWRGNTDLLKILESDSTDAGKERLHYFRINMGPWSQLDRNVVFIETALKEKPSGVNYYPEDMGKNEFVEWIGTLSEKDREKAIGFFYVVKRNKEGKLKIVPYGEEYKEWLFPASNLLKEAAKATVNTSLKKYLLSRAEAFLSNDYYPSDIAWMELDSRIDLTIGPYETYMDELFGYKAAFEAFVTLRDDGESSKLARFSSYLQEIENNLPFDPKYRNPKLAPFSPIRVVDVIYTSGDANRGVQTAAFNLPNDERIIRDKGAKRVMLRNVQEAKFKNVLIPISKIVLDQSHQSRVSFDAFFTHILAHELMHGLGPHNISVNGRATNVRHELKDLYSAIEEAKADITGLFALQFLIDRGYIDEKIEREMYTTFLASMFRSVRFGINEAHGKGVAIQFNFLTEEGAIVFNRKSGTYSIDEEKVKKAVEKLTGILLLLEAEGSYTKAEEIVDKYANIRPDMQSVIDKLYGIPVDIEPIFPLVTKKVGSIR